MYGLIDLDILCEQYMSHGSLEANFMNNQK